MITAVIIALNEEKRIADCIKSAFTVADEVLVCDTGSTDRTLELAKKNGAKVIVTQWQGFAKTKNYANALASHSHILSLDADELLSPELVSSIQSVKSNLKGAYSMNRLNNYCGQWIKHGGWYPDAKVRLFPKNDAIWEGEGAHEDLTVKSIPITHLSGDLLHYTYETEAQLSDKTRRYASLSAETLTDKPKLILAFKMIFSPVYRFFRMYILQLGFLDGKAGFTIARYASQEVFLKYRKAF